VKFRSERDALVEALSTAARAAGTRGAAGAGVTRLLLECADNALRIVGTDLDMTIQVVIEVIGLDDGSCVIPARLASDIVRSLEPGAVTVEAGEDQVEISAARSRFALRSFPTVEFPTVTTPDALGFALPRTLLAEGLRQVVRAASNDDARPLLTGVLITGDGDTMRLVATDSYRLALRDLQGAAGFPHESDTLVPARALAELQRLSASAAPEDDTVHVVTGPQGIVFRSGNVEISTRLLDGTYPDYRQLIPDQYPNSLHVGKESFVAALRRVRLMVRDNTTPVRLSMRTGGVDLSVVSQEIGDASETVDGDFTGEDLVIAFNPTYLLDGVDAVLDDEVVIETADPARPAAVKGAEDTQFQYLLMPVRVS
jgi:DNA polymerase III subunit beta